MVSYDANNPQCKPNVIQLALRYLVYCFNREGYYLIDMNDIGTLGTITFSAAYKISRVKISNNYE